MAWRGGSSWRRGAMVALTGAVVGGVFGAVVAPRPALAWYRGYGWGGGWGGGVVVVPPPIVFPVPAYPGPVYAAPVYPGPVYPGPIYAAPPAYVPPAAYGAPVAAQTCYAGLVTCPLTKPLTVGASCGCPAGSGEVFGAAG